MSIDLNTKILLVEDSKTALKMEHRALQALGYQNVLLAEDGTPAIEILQRETDIGLIISDWNMPDTSGFELLVWVRQNEATKDIPFIMATARGERKQVDTASDAGVSNFITKPFGPPDLKQIIEETFGKPDGSAMKKETIPCVPKMASANKVILNIAHIQITDHLTLGVLKELINTGKLSPQYFELKTQCLTSWNALQGALEQGKVEGAFALAPITMDLYSAGVPLKLVLFAHRNGSTAVMSKVDPSKPLADAFLGKTFYIPYQLSIHHMLAHKFLTSLGLIPGFKGVSPDTNVYFEVVPPVKMPELMAGNPDACGFLVAEPMGTKAVAEGSADELFLSGDMWENHPCCVVAMRDEVIDKHPEAVQEFTEMLVAAGKFITNNTTKAAEIAVDFLDPQGALGLKVAVLKNVLKEQQGIKTDNLYPAAEDLDIIQNYMIDKMGVGTKIDVTKFVDTRFAETACAGGSRSRSKLHDTSEVIETISARRRSGGNSKSTLNIEGTYLKFKLNTRDYGVDILWVKEIIPMAPIRSVPHSPPHVHGLINFRGSSIPIVSLKNKLGVRDAQIDMDNARIIVLEHRDSNNSKSVGIVVDSVSSVFNVAADRIADASSFRTPGNANYILAFAKMDDGMKILLDSENVFDVRLN